MASSGYVCFFWLPGVSGETDDETTHPHLPPQNIHIDAYLLALEISNINVPCPRSIGTSIISPATKQLQEEFGVGVAASLVPLSLYVFALGLGPVLGGPLSETVGRYPTYTVLGSLGALFTLGCGLVHSFAGLCVLRFLSGFCFAPALAVSAGVLNDVFYPRERGVPSALFVLTPFLGPGVA
jgi:MFS family permease